MQHDTITEILDARGHRLSFRPSRVASVHETAEGKAAIILRDNPGRLLQTSHPYDDLVAIVRAADTRRRPVPRATDCGGDGPYRVSVTDPDGGEVFFAFAQTEADAIRVGEGIIELHIDRFQGLSLSVEEWQ